MQDLRLTRYPAQLRPSISQRTGLAQKQRQTSVVMLGAAAGGLFSCFRGEREFDGLMKDVNVTHRKGWLQRRYPKWFVNLLEKSRHSRIHRMISLADRICSGDDDDSQKAHGDFEKFARRNQSLLSVPIDGENETLMDRFLLNRRLIGVDILLRNKCPLPAPKNGASLLDLLVYDVNPSKGGEDVVSQPFVDNLVSLLVERGKIDGLCLDRALTCLRFHSQTGKSSVILSQIECALGKLSSKAIEKMTLEATKKSKTKKDDDVCSKENSESKEKLEKEKSAWRFMIFRQLKKFV